MPLCNKCKSEIVWTLTNSQHYIPIEKHSFNGAIGKKIFNSDRKLIPLYSPELGHIAHMLTCGQQPGQEKKAYDGPKRPRGRPRKEQPNQPPPNQPPPNEPKTGFREPIILEPYRTLCILPTAPVEVIKAAYKALSLLYHPDRPNGNEEKMKKVNMAYTKLEKLGVIK